MKEGDKLIPFPGGDLPPLPDQLIPARPVKTPHQLELRRKLAQRGATRQLRPRANPAQLDLCLPTGASGSVGLGARHPRLREDARWTGKDQ